MRRRIIHICGTHPDLVDLDAMPGEVWILGASYARQGSGPWARAFDVHPLHQTAYHPGILGTRPEAWRWYQQQTKPIYLIDAHPDVPASVAYPRAAIAARFGVRADTAFASSIDQMMALALFEGCDEIRLEMVRMHGIGEWYTQRETLGYWIGRAEGMGVTVVTDPLSALCQPETVYGFGDVTGVQRAPACVLVNGLPGMVQ